MDGNKAFLEILELAKPIIITYRSRKRFSDECRMSGIYITINFEVTGDILEENIETLSSNLSSTILKIIVRRIMRKYRY